MANLFEISAAIANEEWIDKDTGEIDVAFLDRLEMTFAEKSENIIKYIKNLTEEQFLKWAMVNAEDLLKYKTPEINKTELKDRLKAGENIPFVSLKQDKSLQIR